MYKMSDFSSVFVDSFARLQEEYGQRMYFYHRADLHAGLRELVKSLGVVVQLNSALDSAFAMASGLGMPVAANFIMVMQ